MKETHAKIKKVMSNNIFKCFENKNEHIEIRNKVKILLNRYKQIEL
tara:strand:- start:10 stop:147 length:138 start_codon:yes stop_codon:yes gene_type:complete